MKYYVKNSLVTAAIALMPISIWAQTELRTISEYMTLPEDRRDIAYPFVRCIGLFQGVYGYGGANFSEDYVARIQTGNEAMGQAALQLRIQKHPDIELNLLAKQLGNEIEELTVYYEKRMSKNYSLTGEAYGSDSIIIDDFQSCKEIVQYTLDWIQD